MCQWKTKKINRPLWPVFLMLAVFGVHLICPVAAEAVFVYDSEGNRDPFVPLIGVAGASSASGVGGVTSLDGVSLQGIIVGPAGNRSVILNGEIMKEGDIFGDLTIVTISNNKVTVKIGQQTHDLRLYE